MYRSRTVWRLNYRMVLSAELELEPANWNPHPGPFPSPTNATSTTYCTPASGVPLLQACMSASSRRQQQPKAMQVPYGTLVR